MKQYERLEMWYLGQTNRLKYETVWINWGMEKKLSELFEEIINTRGVHHQLEMHEGTVRTYRKRYADGKMTVEKMREVLMKAGYKMVQEERWGR